jgi:hypothetical protein
LVEKPVGRRPLGIHSHGWEDNFKTGLNVTKGKIVD